MGDEDPETPVPPSVSQAPWTGSPLARGLLQVSFCLTGHLLSPTLSVSRYSLHVPPHKSPPLIPHPCSSRAPQAETPHVTCE